MRASRQRKAHGVVGERRERKRRKMRGARRSQAGAKPRVEMRLHREPVALSPAELKLSYHIVIIIVALSKPICRQGGSGKFFSVSLRRESTRKDTFAGEVSEPCLGRSATLAVMPTSVGAVQEQRTLYS